jgi:ribose/xylose/arabinose/galactoside ABC-type transport system permease subunit
LEKNILNNWQKVILMSVLIGALLVGLFRNIFQEVSVTEYLTLIVIVALLLTLGLLRIYKLLKERRRNK